MNKDKKTSDEILEEETKDLLSEDSLKQIEEAVEQKVEEKLNEKVSLHVEKALAEQDEQYSSKLEQLLGAIDKDHTSKMKVMIEAIDKKRTAQLKAVVEKYENALNEEAGSFKNSTIDHISDYLDVYLKDAIPQETLQEAVNNKRAITLLEKIRKMLGVDKALVSESIKEAVVDGKNQIVEASEKLEVAQKRIVELEESFEKSQRDLILEQKTSKLDKRKKAYVSKMLEGKDAKFIEENFDYTLKMFEKTEDKRLQELKKEASTKTSNVDRPVINEKAEEKAEVVEENTQVDGYLGELEKLG